MAVSPTSTRQNYFDIWIRDLNQTRQQSHLSECSPSSIDNQGMNFDQNNSKWYEQLDSQLLKTQSFVNSSRYEQIPQTVESEPLSKRRASLDKPLSQDLPITQEL